MANKMEFKRGDDTVHYFVMPTSAWTAGGNLFFTAKPAIDDDGTDANAVIDRTFTDADAVNDGTNVTYTLTFPAFATNNIPSQGNSKREFIAEFQFVTAAGEVQTFPGNDNYISAVVYFDVRRKTL